MFTLYCFISLIIIVFTVNQWFYWKKEYLTLMASNRIGYGAYKARNKWEFYRWFTFGYVAVFTIIAVN